METLSSWIDPPEATRTRLKAQADMEASKVTMIFSATTPIIIAGKGRAKTNLGNRVGVKTIGGTTDGMIRLERATDKRARVVCVS